MVKIKGTYQGRNRFASFEAHQLDEGWELIVQCHGNRLDETTLALIPWPIIDRMIATALDTANKSGEAPQYDFNAKRPRANEPARRRKRSQPHGLVTTNTGEPLNVQQPWQRPPAASASAAFLESENAFPDWVRCIPNQPPAYPPIGLSF
ncbi:MAG: hypothetical protein WCD78_15710 [Pseudolabrys sp.]